MVRVIKGLRVQVKKDKVDGGWIAEWDQYGAHHRHEISGGTQQTILDLVKNDIAELDAGGSLR
jgi:hypothetical protein